MMPAGGSDVDAVLEDAALLAKLIVEGSISEKTMGKSIDQMWEHAVPHIKRSDTEAISFPEI
jgi:hypothetical protein